MTSDGPSKQSKLLSGVKHICLLSPWRPLHMLEELSLQLGVQPEQLVLCNVFLV
jgi:hypothetical protein